jgi:phosphoribosyl 1,2-cyclic phosphate phosphodiesterase
MVESENTRIVVDSTPDFRYQMLRADVKKLDAIVFTHPHKDHIAGLDDVRAFNYFSGKPMQVYANEMTQEVIIREFPYAFADTRYPGVPEIRLNSISMDPFIVGDIPIQPITVWHLKMPVLGFRFGRFTYVTDANRIDESEKDKIRGSEILVLNALRNERHISHFTISEAVELALNLNVPRAYFTHISHQLGLHASVNSSLPDNMELAFDGLNFEV